MAFYKTEKKYIDKPWKVTFWLLTIDGIVRFPLRFLRPYISLETIDVLFILRFLTFLLAIFLTGTLYVKSTKKSIDRKLKVRVSLYYGLYTLLAWLFLTAALGGVFVNMFGGFLEGLIAVVASVATVYFILPLANRQKKK